MFKANLLSCFGLFFIFFASAQKATIVLDKSFNHISLSGKKIDINLLADDKYAVVTNGFTSDELSISLNNGLLEVVINQRETTDKETLVILYPWNEPVPKVVGHPIQLVSNINK